MSDLHAISRVLLTIVENQSARMEAAFEGLREDVFRADPGGGCNSIEQIGRHLVQLRRFQLVLLESARSERVMVPEEVESVEAMLETLRGATEEFRLAIAEHEPEDWYRVPLQPRPGKWGDEATLVRVVRPLNDFVNHLGSVRAVRRMMGNGAERTQ